MANFYIIINPTGTMQTLDIPDSLYDAIDYTDFGMHPVKSNDIRVRNLASAGNTVEMPFDQFENLQKFIKLYQQMQDKIQTYAQISSYGLASFLLRDIFSTQFGEQIPLTFSRFPQLARVYQEKMAVKNEPYDGYKNLVLLRPTFAMSLLDAYFEQNFVISAAKLSEEKFANASFFDGSAEFKVDIEINDVVVTIEESYQFSCLTITVPGTYSPTHGYHFDYKNWRLHPEFNKQFDAQLYDNKQVYVSKIINQSHTANGLEDITACLVTVATQFLQAEAKRLEGLPKSLKTK